LEKKAETQVREIKIEKEISPEDIDEEKFEEFLEEDFEPLNPRRIISKPFLEQRQVINLEQDLEDVPTARTNENSASVTYSSGKSSYAPGLNADYGNAVNAPMYSDAETMATRQNINENSIGIGSNAFQGFQDIDFKRWQQANTDMVQNANQQENYRTLETEKIRQDAGLPFQQKRKEKFI
jgi:hypothetical protein